MWHITKILPVTSFTFGSYRINAERQEIVFTYRVEFKFGLTKTFTDRLLFKDLKPQVWEKAPKAATKTTLQALLLMLGINYYLAFPTRNIQIEGFTLTREQAQFWNTLYLNGLGEYFYLMKIDFRNLIDFPYSNSAPAPTPSKLDLPARALLLNGAGKDSALSAEILKAAGQPFDFFAFNPTPAHERITRLAGAKAISVRRRRDPWLNAIISGAYPSVSTFTFIATLLAEILGYNSIIFSNERSADFGNLNYLGLPVNHQWCKSSEAEKLINNYIGSNITPDISTRSLLREYSELEIVRRFLRYPQYLHGFTSCNTYFWLSRTEQLTARGNYWCKRCPKCVFLFACFSAFLPKKQTIKIFGANLYAKKRLLPLFRRILGIEGFKPLDCVGEPEEMILAMHYAAQRKEYAGEPAIRLFETFFPAGFAFGELERRVFATQPYETTATTA